MKKQLQKALHNFSEEQIKTSIANYGTMYRDPNYEFCNYAWSLDTFLSRQKGYKLFMEDGERWINYQRFLKQRNRASPTSKPNAAPKCETTGEQFEIYVSPIKLEALKESG
jgi:hypothetical protein